jgi:serine/threonine protein kinase
MLANYGYSAEKNRSFTLIIARSQVYKVMAPNRKIFALKRIRLTGRDREAAAGFIDEITLLQRLRGHSNIIQLIDAEVRQAINADGTFQKLER